MKRFLEVLLYILVTIGLITLCSCEKEDVLPEVCTGGCEAYLDLPYELDENGYYHIDLDWDGQYYPRFTIDTYASPTEEFWHYNGVSVVQANFYTDKTWKLNNDILPIVQKNRIYLSPNKNSSKLYGRRVVGPFPPEMEGDTITINAVIFWDAGINYLEKEISINFIVE